MRTVTAMDQAERSDDGRTSGRFLVRRAVTPPAPSDPRTLTEEVVVVLMLSLLASAVYAILSLFEAPLAGTIVASANQSTQLARQFAGFVFGAGLVASIAGHATFNLIGVLLVALAQQLPNGPLPGS